jgi:hypothetical protein
VRCSIPSAAHQIQLATAITANVSAAEPGAAEDDAVQRVRLPAEGPHPHKVLAHVLPAVHPAQPRDAPPQVPRLRRRLWRGRREGCVPWIVLGLWVTSGLECRQGRPITCIHLQSDAHCAGLQRTMQHIRWKEGSSPLMPVHAMSATSQDARGSSSAFGPKANRHVSTCSSFRHAFLHDTSCEHLRICLKACRKPDFVVCQNSCNNLIGSVTLEIPVHDGPIPEAPAAQRFRLFL